MSSRKVPIIRVRFSKYIQISDFINTCPVGAEFFHMGRYDKANGCCSQFCKCG